MEKLTLRVAAVDDSVPGIRSLTLVGSEGAFLSPFTPGSHLVVDCGSHANAYSLTGETLSPTAYHISVLRLADGAGGSRWIHDELRTGDHVSVVPPRSAFAPDNTATSHLFIAGGIGVTPMLSHVRAARTWGRPFHMLYTYRDGYGAHIHELEDLAGDHIEFFTGKPAFAERFDVLLRHQPIGTHLYACGPAGLMDHVCQTAADHGWPTSRVHLERFGVDALDPGEPFEVRLTKSRTTVAVAPGVSLLNALENEGHRIPSLCRQGVCGECRIPVSEGDILHRDLFLTDAEKEAGDAMLCCVSRAFGTVLEVPL